MRAEKQQLSKDIQSLLGSSSGAFLVSYKGATVSEFSALRKELRLQRQSEHGVHADVGAAAVPGGGALTLSGSF